MDTSSWLLYCLGPSIIHILLDYLQKLFYFHFFYYRSLLEYWCWYYVTFWTRRSICTWWWWRGLLLSLSSSFLLNFCNLQSNICFIFYLKYKICYNLLFKIFCWRKKHCSARCKLSACVKLPGVKLCQLKALESHIFISFTDILVHLFLSA